MTQALKETAHNQLHLCLFLELVLDKNERSNPGGIPSPSYLLNFSWCLQVAYQGYYALSQFFLVHLKEAHASDLA
jgi:hypothetical protein